MQLFFSLGFFLASLAFTGYGLSSLDLSDSIGRPGPGYFPLIIGIMLMASTGYGTWKLYRQNKIVTTIESDIDRPEFYGRDTLVVILLITLFLATLQSLGSILSMVLFMVLFLGYFNKGDHKLNIIYSLLLPLGVYLLFDVLLRAGLPKGIFD